MSDTTYKSKVGYKPPVELDYHEGTPEIKSVNILDQVEEYVVAQCSVAVGVKIDREELIKALLYDRGQYEKGYADGKHDAAAAIEALQAQLPKRGKWIYKPKDAIEMMFTLPKCSVCGHESSDANNFCPNCGAKMEVQE